MPVRKFCSALVPDADNTNQGVLKGAYQTTKKWPANYKLKIMFLEGTPAQKKMVRDCVSSSFGPDRINLSLSFYEPGMIQNSDIRVTFNEDLGAWSELGVDALMVPQSDATLNLGWLDEGVIRHEFGHAIGPWIHEHQNPDPSNPLPTLWNREVVIEDLSGPPNNWNLETIEYNVLDAYSPLGITATKWDPKSVMQYFYPAAWTKDGSFSNVNPDLSDTDIALLRATYPTKDYVAPSPNTLGVTGVIENTASTSSKLSTTDIVMIVLGSIIGVLFLSLVIYALVSRNKI